MDDRDFKSTGYIVRRSTTASTMLDMWMATCEVYLWNSAWNKFASARMFEEAEVKSMGGGGGVKGILASISSRMEVRHFSHSPRGDSGGGGVVVFSGSGSGVVFQVKVWFG